MGFILTVFIVQLNHSSIIAPVKWRWSDELPHNSTHEIWSENTKSRYNFTRNTSPERIGISSTQKQWSEYKSWKNNIVTKLEPEIEKDCDRLFSGNQTEVITAKDNQQQWKNLLTDRELWNKTYNCSWVVDTFNSNLYTTKLELSFPIAFVFVVYNSPQQVMRLLKLLYRPHNQYCISPDKKSGPLFIGIFRNLVKCLDNVHLVSTLREVKWGHKSIMESEMCCYKDLMNIRDKQAKKDKWKYVINLCGKELPLTTNHEMVSHLVNLNGASMVEAELVPNNDYESLSRLNNPVPYNISYAKSSTYMSLSPKFIDFLFTNKTAIALYEYFKGNDIPEEHFFPTVYMLPNIPGGRNTNLSQDNKFIVSRYAWIIGIDKSATMCQGKEIHHICIVESGDLNWLLSSNTSHSDTKAFFHNKYFMENDHIVMDCMEERIVARNKLEYENDHKLNKSHLLIADHLNFFVIISILVLAAV